MTQDVLPDPNSEYGARVRKRLTEDMTIWLTTTGKDGTPQPNPVCFLWDGAGSVLIYNRADAARLTHIRNRPRVALNFDTNQGGDVVVLTGAAELVEAPPANENPDYMAKYAELAARISSDEESFAKAYPVPLRVTFTKVRGF
jgi:PPOX class probable F420-dependent enzyme